MEERTADGIRVVPADTPIKDVVAEWRNVIREDFLNRCQKASHTNFYKELIAFVETATEKTKDRAAQMLPGEAMAMAFGMGIVQASCMTRMTTTLSELQMLGEAVGVPMVSHAGDHIMMVMLFNSVGFIVASDIALGLSANSLLEAMPKPIRGEVVSINIPTPKDMPGVH